MRHAFNGALSRVFTFALLVAAIVAVPIAALAQEATAAPAAAAPSAVQYLVDNKSLVILIVCGLASIVAHFVPPTTPFGKFVSWVAGNFGKALTTSKTGLLAIGFVLIFAGSTGCGFIRSEFGPTLAADEINCGETALHNLEDQVKPQLAVIFSTVVSGDFAAALAQFEAAADAMLGVNAKSAILCAASTLASDYDKAHSSDAGVSDAGPGSVPAASHAMTLAAPPDLQAIAAARAKAYLAGQKIKPVHR